MILLHIEECSGLFINCSMFLTVERQKWNFCPLSLANYKIEGGKYDSLKIDKVVEELLRSG